MAPLIKRLFALLLAVVPASAGADPIPTGPLPSWVVDLPLLQASDDAAFIADGLERLLDDTQIRIHGAGETRFFRSVVSVAGRAGLEEAGKIEFDIDPRSDTVTLHRLAVLRDGQMIDMGDTPFIPLRREEGLASGVLNARKTLYAVLPDIRVGDLVEVAYSIDSAPQVFAGEHYSGFFAERENPVRRAMHRVLMPAGTTVRINAPDGHAPRVRTVDGMTEYSWQQTDIPAADMDRFTAPWSIQYGLVEIGTYADWPEVVAAIHREYAPVELTGDLAAFARTTRRTEPDEERRVTAALRLVQEQIRYVSLSIGEGGYIPRRPDAVWQSRFGDCKDKALLLVSLLEAMDIRAEVVLVSTDDGPSVAQRIPSPFAFDHAIVRVRSKGGDYFIDPTDVLQGGIGRAIPVGDFRHALPIVAESPGLVPVNRPVPDKPVHDVVDSYTLLPMDSADAALLDVTTIYRFAKADSMRWSLEVEGIAEREADWLDWYGERFPGIRSVAPVSVVDDLDANEIVLTERYAIPQTAFKEKGLLQKFLLRPYAVRDRMPEIGDGPLEFPLPVDGDLWNRHEMRIAGLPTGLTPPDGKSLGTEFAAFSQEGRRTDDGVAVTWDLRFTVHEVVPGTEAEWREFGTFVEANDGLTYDLARTAWTSPGEPTRGARAWVILVVLAACGMLLGHGLRRGRDLALAEAQIT